MIRLIRTYQSIPVLKSILVGLLLPALLMLNYSCIKDEIKTWYHDPLGNPEAGSPAGNPDGNYEALFII